MEFNNEFIRCNVQILENCSHIKITGTIKNRGLYSNVLLIAANPIDRMGSYSGTGLPFPCADVAFEGTSNSQVIHSDTVNATFTYPNSYYTVAIKKKLVSSIFFVLETHDGKTQVVRFELKDLYPLRTLVNRESRTGPEFYATKYEILPVDTAEIIMKEYAKAKVSHNIA
jgi:hypothetical protein